MHRQTDAVPLRACRSLVPAACLLAALAPAAAASADPVPTGPAAPAAATAPAPPASSASTGDLARGSSGAAVLALQRTLLQLGLPVGRDGQFGAGTEAAVRRYQHEEGQPVTGVVSRAERTAMRRKASPRRRERTFGSRSLRVGVSGTDVRAAQRLLIDSGFRTPTHGQYTTAVRGRVQQWQRKAKMRADGILSPAEARLLRKLAPPPPGGETATPKATGDAAAAPGAAAPPVVAPVTSGYTFPIQGPWHWGGASTLFADRGGAHQGVDAFAACGTPLVAASAGTVRFNQFQAAAGNYLVIGGTPTGEDQAYMHMKAPSPLAPGTPVVAGTPIGEVGDTGNADGCHLHFELWSAPGWYAGGAPRDPKPDLTTWANQSGRPPSTSAR